MLSRFLIFWKSSKILTARRVLDKLAVAACKVKALGPLHHHLNSKLSRNSRPITTTQHVAGGSLVRPRGVKSLPTMADAYFSDDSEFYGAFQRVGRSCHAHLWL